MKVSELIKELSKQDIEGIIIQITAAREGAL